MVPDKIKFADQLARKNTVPPEHTTPKRDKAADWIEQHVVRAKRWPEVTMVQIADESGWSRQHIANTLEHYFEAAEPETGRSLTIDGIDVDMLLEVYREGYRAGMQDARTDDVDTKDMDDVIKQIR